VLPCWSYLTDGLLGVGQKEIALTLQRPPGVGVGEFPRDILELLGMIHDLAVQGQTVDVGDYTEFGPTGFLGRAELRGILYIPYQPIPGTETSGPALCAILVPQAEVELAKAGGVSRVMARLGMASSHFPCPDWSDPDRASVVSAGEADQSVLAQMPRLVLASASVVRHGDGISLDVPRDVVPLLEQQVGKLRSTHALALLTGVPYAADALLVWRPGQQGPLAIGAPGQPGAVVAGCFCGFVPKQAADDAQIFEDGFVVMLTKASWRRIRGALTSGSDLELPAGPGGLAFSIRWS
jgi:hypothetical protein